LKSKVTITYFLQELRVVPGIQVIVGLDIQVVVAFLVGLGTQVVVAFLVGLGIQVVQVVLRIDHKDLVVVHIIQVEVNLAGP
jgi:hypothetical protein